MIPKLVEYNIYNIKKIILVSGSHFKIDFKQSTIYINCIKKFFEEQGFYVSLRLGNIPDDDFVYMSSAKYFLSSGGGYSDIIKKLVKMQGNVVLCEKISGEEDQDDLTASQKRIL